MKTLFYVCLLILTATIAVTPVSAGVALNRIIAVVNDDVVMQSELEDKVYMIKKQLREQGTPLPSQAVLEKQVLERLIVTKLQIQMAEKTGISVDDESLNRTISNIAAENQLSLTQFREVLEGENYNYEKFREDIRDEILISRLQQRQVKNRVMVTEREVENFLANQVYQGNVDQEYRLSHILISIPESASATQQAQAKVKAEMVLHELKNKNGNNFEQLAATYSDGQQALEGGDLGWRKAGQVPSLFAEVVSAMNKDDISELIRNPSGYHIIKLTETRTGEKHLITQTKARHILIRPDELVTDADARLRLEQLNFRIKGGDDFAELARGHSSDTVSAANGGDLGWVSPGDLVPEFEQTMNSLKPGEISPPFRTQFGWHILEVIERREHDSTEELKRSRALDTIRQRKLEEMRETWLREMRDDAYVEYRLE